MLLAARCMTDVTGIDYIDRVIYLVCSPYLSTDVDAAAALFMAWLDSLAVG